MPGCLLPGLGVGNDVIQVEDHAKCLIWAHVVPHAIPAFYLQDNKTFKSASQANGEVPLHEHHSTIMHANA